MTPSSMTRAFLLFAILQSTTILAFQQNAFYYAKQSAGQLYSELTRNRANDDRIDNVYFMTYTIHPAGGVIVGGPEAAGETLASQHGVKKILGLDNMGPYFYDPVRVTKALGKFQARILNQLVALATKGGYDGVFLDLENVPKSMRRAYPAFANKLKSSLHALNKTLTIAVPASTADVPSSPSIGGYDFRALANAADYLFVMTWDQVVGKPGPIASLPWVTAAVNFTKTLTNSSQIIMAIPTYGYKYGVTFPKMQMQGFSWTEIGQILSGSNVIDVVTSLNGDLVSASSNYKLSYPNNISIEYVIWHENFDSVRAKTLFAISADIGGVGVYALGIDSPVTWDAVMLV